LLQDLKRNNSDSDSLDSSLNSSQESEKENSTSQSNQPPNWKFDFSKENDDKNNQEEEEEEGEDVGNVDSFEFRIHKNSQKGKNDLKSDKNVGLSLVKTHVASIKEAEGKKKPKIK